MYKEELVNINRKAGQQTDLLRIHNKLSLIINLFHYSFFPYRLAYL